jgi:hypothetical protein
MSSGTILHNGIRFEALWEGTFEEEATVGETTYSQSLCTILPDQTCSLTPFSPLITL